MLAVDEAGEFGERIFIALRRRCCRPTQPPFKLVEINHRALPGDGLTHHFHLKMRRSRDESVVATLPLFQSPHPSKPIPRSLR
ncbi:MAG: hypothetical protein WCF20_06840 [Methylovirgula sp.]